MILLALMLLGAIIVMALIFFTVNGFFTAHNRSRFEADTLALSLASSMNESDRIAQINDLQASSRELVFTSRARAAACRANDMEMLEPLCNTLVSEARDGYRLVEGERINQIQVICTKLQKDAIRHNKDVLSRKDFSLMWLTAHDPLVTRIDVGRIANVHSNVRRSSAVCELAEHDVQQGLVDKQSKLIKADVNAKLPYVDTDLNFKISGLPAFVDGTCSPARNVNANVFIPTGTILRNGEKSLITVDQIPNAIQVTCSMDAALGDHQEYKRAVNLVATGAATGAIAGTGL